MLAVMVAPTVGINPLDPVWIATLVGIVTVSSAGVAGVGGGATFAALIVLPAMGLPVTLVALLISVEPLIDMGRTALNVSGAMTAGTITSTPWNNAYGNLTTLTTADGTVLYYAHQSATNVTVGQRVTAGTVIGKVGATGQTATVTVFPALAGMNRVMMRWAPVLPSVPRARGDEPAMGLQTRDANGCSPRSRG